MTHSQRSPDIPRLLAVLETHQVRYVLTGSVAALVYGVDVGIPGDLDITPALDEDNLVGIVGALRDMEAMLDPDEPPGHWEVQSDGERRWITEEFTPEVIVSRKAWEPDPSNIGSLDHLFLTQYGNFDVVPDLSGTYETLKQRAVEVQAYGQAIWVAHVDDLLVALTVPRRKKDAPRVYQLRVLQRKFGDSHRFG